MNDKPKTYSIADGHYNCYSCGSILLEFVELESEWLEEYDLEQQVEILIKGHGSGIFICKGCGVGCTRWVQYRKPYDDM